MATIDDDLVMEVSLRVSAAFLGFYHVYLGRPAYGSDLWKLIVGSTDYLGRPDCTMPGPPEVGEFPARTRMLTAEQVEPFLRRIAGLVLPARPAYTGGLDGDTFSLKFERGLSSVEYNWWAEVPAPWEPLGHIVDELLSLAGEPSWPRPWRGDGPPSRA
jgi:hypothetical protein